jgi:hypothetical protein
MKSLLRRSRSSDFSRRGCSTYRSLVPFGSSTESTTATISIRPSRQGSGKLHMERHFRRASCARFTSLARCCAGLSGGPAPAISSSLIAVPPRVPQPLPPAIRAASGRDLRRSMASTPRAGPGARNAFRPRRQRPHGWTATRRLRRAMRRLKWAASDATSPWPGRVWR